VSMGTIVKTSTRAFFPLLLVYGLYVIANGHLTPGGGFQGGVLFGSAFILLLIGFGYNKVSAMVSDLKLSLIQSAGALTFVLIGLAGMLFANGFLQNWLAHELPGHFLSAGTMPFLDLAVGVNVGAGVFIIALMMLAILWEEDGVD